MSVGKTTEGNQARTNGVEDLATVLDLLRFGHARTRPELAQLSGLSRAAVTQQLDQLLELGLVTEGGLVRSGGGRAPRSLAFCANAGILLVAELDAASMTAGVTDLAGRLLTQHEEPFNVGEGPDEALKQLAELFDVLLKESGVPRESVWGAGLGLPGPVEFSTGRSTSPPIMPGWHAYPVRQQLERRLGLTVWVDNDVNLMILGELRSGRARSEQNVVFLNIGSGIGAAIVSGGNLYRGTQGCAGEIGHVVVSEASDVVCRCGKLGCLEALAGGAALARDGAVAAESGRSPYLATVVAGGRAVTAEEITNGTQRGDAVCQELVLQCGRLVGKVLATIVNFFNPQLILIGGILAGAGDILLAGVRESVYRYSLPIAARDLQISLSPLGDEAGMRGAAAMVTDEFFAPSQMAQWIGRGSPAVAAGD